MIVHDSLYNYIYVDLRRLGVPQGVCFFLTFLISALVHEYIIALSLKFFYPVLLVMFLFFGVGFVFLTKHCATTGKAWNIFFCSLTRDSASEQTELTARVLACFRSSFDCSLFACIVICRSGANLIIGNGMLLIMYSREYYVRLHERAAAHLVRCTVSLTLVIRLSRLLLCLFRHETRRW